jgi:hypothetical protein
LILSAKVIYNAANPQQVRQVQRCKTVIFIHPDEKIRLKNGNTILLRRVLSSGQMITPEGKKNFTIPKSSSSQMLTSVLSSRQMITRNVKENDVILPDENIG